MGKEFEWKAGAKSRTDLIMKQESTIKAKDQMYIRDLSRIRANRRKRERERKILSNAEG